MRSSIGAVLVALAVAGGSASASPAASTPLAAGGDVRCEERGTAADTARVVHGAEAHDVGGLTVGQQRAFERSVDHRLAQLRQRGVDLRAEPRRTIEIRTFVHVIRRNDGTGGVSDKTIARQMRVLNRGFNGGEGGGAANTAFRFELAHNGVRRTDNSDFYNWNFQDDDKRAKRKLHRGTRADLNIYVSGLRQGLLGYAFFPGTVAPYRDGLVILNESMPGGRVAPYNRGDTATHEVGHWLGLYHTFQRGCRKPGDKVGDTPRQNNGRNIFRCDDFLNTCRAPGGDPVHNYMNYSTDRCMTQFTSGQARRMLQVWRAKRDLDGRVSAP